MRALWRCIILNSSALFRTSVTNFNLKIARHAAVASQNRSSFFFQQEVKLNFTQHQTASISNYILKWQPGWPIRCQGRPVPPVTSLCSASKTARTQAGNCSSLTLLSGNESYTQHTELVQQSCLVSFPASYKKKDVRDEVNTLYIICLDYETKLQRLMLYNSLESFEIWSRRPRERDI